MPDPERLRRTIERATKAFRATPGRQGRTVMVQDCREILVAGDLHGNVENFRVLLEKAQLARHPQRHFVLQELIHGPHRYPAGGDKSHQLLDLLAALKCQFPRQVHMLLGNHELAQWTGAWIGKEGEEDLNEQFERGIQTAYGESADAIQAAYRGLFGAMSVAVRTPNRVFICHSLPSSARLNKFDIAGLLEDDPGPEAFQPGGTIHALVWGRDTRAETVQEFLHRVGADWLITGHIPSPEGFQIPNDRQLVLDCLGAPAGYALLPTDRALSRAELVGSVHVI